MPSMPDFCITGLQKVKLVRHWNMATSWEPMSHPVRGLFRNMMMKSKLFFLCNEGVLPIWSIKDIVLPNFWGKHRVQFTYWIFDAFKSLEHMIKLRNIRKAYKTEYTSLEVLKGIDLDIA